MRPTRSPRPAGFALAELLVAATLLVVGVLALAGAATQLARAESEGRVVAAAAALIAERLERALAACRDTSGVRLARGLDERWRSTRVGGAVRVADTVRYALPTTGAHAVGVDGAVRCVP